MNVRLSSGADSGSKVFGKFWTKRFLAVAVFFTICVFTIAPSVSFSSVESFAKTAVKASTASVVLSVNDHGNKAAETQLEAQPEAVAENRVESPETLFQTAVAPAQQPNTLVIEDLSKISPDTCLGPHNYYRHAHGVKALKWDHELEKKARAWLHVHQEDKEAQVDSSSSVFVSKTKATCSDAVMHFYAQGAKVNIHEHSETASAHDFIQLLWKETTHVGCAGDESAVVCHYAPHANHHHVSSNVLPVTDAEDLAPGLESSVSCSVSTTRNTAADCVLSCRSVNGLPAKCDPSDFLITSTGVISDIVAMDPHRISFAFTLTSTFRSEHLNNEPVLNEFGHPILGDITVYMSEKSVLAGLQLKTLKAIDISPPDMPAGHFDKASGRRARTQVPNDIDLAELGVESIEELEVQMSALQNPPMAVNPTLYTADTCLGIHNFYRSLHQAPAVAWSATLASAAQTWANTMASKEQLYHDSNAYFLNQGENVIRGSGAVNCWGAVAYWYSENAYYNFAVPGYYSAAADFTQMVWKSTTQVGCAATKSAVTGYTYIACRYSSSGNIGGQYGANVLSTSTSYRASGVSSSISVTSTLVAGGSITSAWINCYTTPSLKASCSASEFVITAAYGKIQNVRVLWSGYVDFDYVAPSYGVTDYIYAEFSSTSVLKGIPLTAKGVTVSSSAPAPAPSASPAPATATPVPSVAPSTAPSVAPAPTPMPDNRVPPTPVDMTKFDATTCLPAHNVYRRTHQVGDLTWDATLASHAQAYAATLATTLQMAHDPTLQTIGEGENLFMATTTSTYSNCVFGVGSWYDEINLLNWNDVANYQSGTGHFTQVVWKATTQVGCGAAYGGGYTWLVCRYKVPGNLIGSFAQNVLPAVGAVSQNIGPDSTLKCATTNIGYGQYTTCRIDCRSTDWVATTCSWNDFFITTSYGGTIAPATTAQLMAAFPRARLQATSPSSVYFTYVAPKSSVYGLDKINILIGGTNYMSGFSVPSLYVYLQSAVPNPIITFAPTPTPSPTPIPTATPTPTPTPSPTPTPGPVDEQTADYQVTMALINHYRAVHGSPALTWSYTLVQDAANWLWGQRWCQHKAEWEAAYLNEGQMFAINYFPTGTKTTKLLSDSYKLLSSYNFSSPAMSPFTTMIWKGTTTIGCSYLRDWGTNGNNPTGFYLACRLKPVGNVAGQFATNILPALSGPFPAGLDSTMSCSGKAAYGSSVLCTVTCMATPFLSGNCDASTFKFSAIWGQVSNVVALTSQSVGFTFTAGQTGPDDRITVQMSESTALKNLTLINSPFSGVVQAPGGKVGLSVFSCDQTNIPYDSTVKCPLLCKAGNPATVVACPPSLIGFRSTYNKNAWQESTDQAYEDPLFGTIWSAKISLVFYAPPVGGPNTATVTAYINGQVAGTVALTFY